MSKLSRSFIVMLFILSVFSQCSKELSSNSGNIEIVTPEPITAHLQGNIVDENDQPAAGVTITVGSKSVITDASGYFRILNADLDKKTALVTAVKTGYFKAYRVFSATTGTNQVAIKLIKKTVAGTVDAVSGGNISLTNGAKILFPANGIVLASGGAYAGTVNVYAKYIDPTAADISETVPGSFAANDKNGKRVLLSSYGMIAVELESASGEKLQIKEGAVATLTMPIPSSILSSAPATIAMWSIDDQTGLWKEEGSGTKQGNNYVGDVKHFSFWNYDQSINAVFLSMTLKTANNQLLTYTRVKITSSTNGVAFGITDSLGQLGGLVPANEILTLEILNQCYDVIYSQTISPLSQDTDIGEIIASSTSLVLSSLKGRLLDCNGAPVTNGHVMFSINNWTYNIPVNSNGEFNSDPFSGCSSSSYKLIGIDETGNQQSAVIPISIVDPVTNVGDIITCNTSAAQFINYTIDGTNYSMTSGPNQNFSVFNYGGSSNYVQGFSGHNIVTNDSVSLGFSGALTTGTYDVKYVSLTGYYQATVFPPFTLTFTKFALAFGEFYEGSFTGSFRGNTQTIHTTTGTFRIRRNF